MISNFQRKARTWFHPVSLAWLTCLFVPSRTVAGVAAPGSRPNPKAWLGIYMGTSSKGVRIEQVFPGTPAERAGLRAGDILVAISGRAVATPGRVASIVSACRPGQKIVLEVLRGDRRIRLPVVLGRRPDDRQLQKQVLATKSCHDLVFRTLSGDRRTGRQFAGKWVLVEFWSPYCGACLRSVPRVEAWRRRFAPFGIRFLLLTSDRILGRRRLPVGIAGAVGTVDEATKASFLVTYLPTFLLCDPRGRIRGVWWGAGRRTLSDIEHGLVRAARPPRAGGDSGGAGASKRPRGGRRGRPRNGPGARHE